ncbi:MAG: hypothetical protein ACLUGQ_13880 [Coprococcus sp.]
MIFRLFSLTGNRCRRIFFSGDKLFYVGCDAAQSGEMQGEIAAEYIKNHPEVDKNGDGKIQYVLLEGEAGHQDAISRDRPIG